MKKLASNVIEFRPREAGVRAQAVAGGGGGGMSSGGNGGDLERRVGRLEAAVENISVVLTDIRSDIRLILGGGLSGGVLLLGAIIGSHLRLHDEIRVLHEKDDAIIATMSSRNDALIARMDSSVEIGI